MATRIATPKTPPYSIHSEKAVLGSVLADPKLFDDVRAILGDDPRVFFRDDMTAIWSALVRLRSAGELPADSRALRDALAGAGFAHPDRQSDLREIAGSAVERRALTQHAETVREKARRRHLLAAVTDVIHELYYSAEPTDAILDRFRASLDGI
jgi:replicative DNA helicase